MQPKSEGLAQLIITNALARFAQNQLAGRFVLPVVLIGLLAIAAACGSSGTASLDDADPLPPVSELATSEGLLNTASESVRSCLTNSFTAEELRQNLELYINNPFAGILVEECDPEGVQLLAYAGSAVAEQLPSARAPFGLDSANLPSNTEDIRALFERAQYGGQGTVTGDDRQVEVRFPSGESDAINVGTEFTGLPEGTAPTVLIGTMLIFIENASLPESRLGGTDGDLTWLKFIPPQSPDRHSILWAQKDTRWAYSATADSEDALEQLIKALIDAS